MNLKRSHQYRTRALHCNANRRSSKTVIEMRRVRNGQGQFERKSLKKNESPESIFTESWYGKIIEASITE